MADESRKIDAAFDEPKIKKHKHKIAMADESRKIDGTFDEPKRKRHTYLKRNQTLNCNKQVRVETMV